MATITKRENSNGSISWKAQVRIEGYPARTASHKSAPQSAGQRPSRRPCKELMIRGTDTMCREYRPPVSYPRPIHDPLQLFHGLSVDLCGAKAQARCSGQMFVGIRFLVLQILIDDHKMIDRVTI
jgi:hypothetical protein